MCGEKCLTASVRALASLSVAELGAVLGAHCQIRVVYAKPYRPLEARNGQRNATSLLASQRNLPRYTLALFGMRARPPTSRSAVVTMACCNGSCFKTPHRCEKIRPDGPVGPPHPRDGASARRQRILGIRGWWLRAEIALLGLPRAADRTWRLRNAKAQTRCATSIEACPCQTQKGWFTQANGHDTSPACTANSQTMCFDDSAGRGGRSAR